jgi:nucleoside-diphosphate-sugar epimerase
MRNCDRRAALGGGRRRGRVQPREIAGRRKDIQVLCLVERQPFGRFSASNVAASSTKSRNGEPLGDVLVVVPPIELVTSFVGDVVRALIGLMHEPAAVGKIFNIGNTEEVSILDLAHRVRTLSGSASPIVLIPYDQAYEAGFEDMPRRVPDISKIKTLVGYAPTVELDEILTRVIEHFRQQ